MDTSIQRERFVEKFAPRRDLTFFFYADGKLEIKHTDTDELVLLSELNRESKEFYVQKRIAFIKNRLLKVNHKYQ